MSKFEVQTNFGNNWENVWHEGFDELVVFDTAEEAQAEIDDMIEEMELVGMDYDRNDYRIVEII
jgi:hypothetical protein